MLPKYLVMYTNYPKDRNPETVKKAIGGHVDAEWITNTCTIRLSRAFNYSGVSIPKNFSGMNVVSGADKKWYAFRVQEMKRWIEFRYGRPTFSAVTPKVGVDRKTFFGQKGVIAFDIHFSDATGHLDMWDGSAFTHEADIPEDYFALAVRVALWKCPD